MPLLQSAPKLSMGYQVLIAAILGIIVGIIAGSKAMIFEPIGNIYAMLMEAVVFPYIISTLLLSLGSLKPNLSARLFKLAWPFYLFLMLTVFVTLILLGKALPFNIRPETSVSTDTYVNNNLLQLLIPDNIFADLANNFVPAVIIFCLIFGLALQRINNKDTLFTILEIISKSSLLFWKWLVTFVPIVTFALLASLTGSMRIHQLYDVSEYLIIYGIAVATIFWLIPLIISFFTGIHYKELIYEIRNALIVSAVTTLSVVALPYLEKVISNLLARLDNNSSQHLKEKDEIIKTILLIAYPFAQLGNYLAYLFVLFAAVYYDQAIKANDVTLLPIFTFLSGIGSPSSSINSVKFLATWIGLPPDTTNLYISLMPITRYGQVIISVLGFAFLGVLVTFSFFGKLKSVNYLKIFTHLLIALIFVYLFALILNNVFPNPDLKIYKRLQSYSLEAQLTNGVKFSVLPLMDESRLTPVKNTEDALFRIQRTGVIRIGFNADMRPFAFYNNEHQLVGYDIAYAFALAKDLNSRIVFVPFTWMHLLDDLRANQFDIAMSAIYATEDRLRSSFFTEPYFHSPVALIVPKKKLSDFRTVEQIKNLPQLRIGIFKDPVLIPLVQNNFPNAKIVILNNLSGNDPATAFQQNQIDAVLWSQVQTDVWTLAHPDYISLVPTGIAAPFLLAYMVQNTSPQFLNFLNYWLTLKKNDGFQQANYYKWILIRKSSGDI